MTLDEFEAMRLADLARMYQEKAAEQMGVSRPTFSRIIDSAHQKVADALVHGKALHIIGGTVERSGRRCCEQHDGALHKEDQGLPTTQKDRPPRNGKLK
jgi:hypothetical protein